jgi:hypothetical protein
MAMIKTLGGSWSVDSTKVCTSLSYQGLWPKTCCKPIKFFRNGIGYCGIHDPEHLQAMQQKRETKLSKEQ